MRHKLKSFKKLKNNLELATRTVGRHCVVANRLPRQHPTSSIAVFSVI